MLWLYALILVVVAIGLWAAYRVLGTPSRLTPPDYLVVLADVATSVERSAGQLREALAHEADGHLKDVAADARKIFQTGYYQTLRLRPATGPDALAAARTELGRACEAYDWASRMIGSESQANPLIRDAALRLLDAGDAALNQAAKELPADPRPIPESTAPSP
ncbi:MAG TPA: hypothetical protein VM674_03020 [Candidatus Acidoferrum sp.]|nr:hypothetical protein [Candidatus Acidoferrum sp.]